MTSPTTTSLPVFELSPEQEQQRWVDIDKLLTRASPLAHPAFTPSNETKKFLQETCRVLIVGAGGLGCDLVKNLALSGFKNIDIIDMDTIDTSNLNRQFLFRDKDVGSSKAITAANFVNKRVPGVKVTPHYMTIQEKKVDFYKQFNIVICGLDSIDARRWMNSTLYDFVKFEDDDKKQVDWSTVIPYIDGGTEGFKGQARVIFPGVTACFECTMDLFTADENFPLCTIKNKPRLPEHCIQYAFLVLWNDTKNKPGIPDGEKVDGDNPKHVKWIYDTALERGKQYNIRGVTYRLTQGVIKRIIPAIASTNAIVASACTNEALKLATLMASPLDDYMFYNGNEGIFTHTFKYEKKEACPVCGQPQLTVKFSKNAPLKAFRAFITKHPQMKLRNVTLKTLGGEYIYTNVHKQLEQIYAPNLDKKIPDLFSDGDTLLITDRQTINCEFRVTVKFTDEAYIEAKDDDDK